MVRAEEYMEVFKKGTIVEVSSEDEGLRGSWYTATVLRSISQKTNKLLVEYHNLMADHDPSKPLREFVEAILLRPIPPRDPPSRRYSAMEDVDAFHNDGWWEGVVTKVLEPSSSEPSRRYAVFFRCSREQIEFTASDLRVHREWVRDDVWVSPFDLSISPRKKRKYGHREARENGTCLVDKNGAEIHVVKGSRNVSSKQISPAKNGHIKEVSGDRLASLRKRQRSEPKNVSNGTNSKYGVKRNGKLK